MYISIYIYRCDHGGVGANRGSFCAFVAGGKGAAREENKEERKKERKTEAMYFFRAGDVDGDGPSSTDEVSPY